ncbi:MAG: hypothetical protein AAF809_15060 [Bacteroidota bacterium]
MAFSYSIHPDIRTVFLRFSGEVDGPQHSAALDTAVQDPAWQVGFDWLVDMRHVALLHITLDDMATMRAQNQRLNRVGSRARSALVMRPSDREIASLYATVVMRDFPPGVERDVQVFLSMTEALAWLGLDAVPG